MLPILKISKNKNKNDLIYKRVNFLQSNEYEKNNNNK